ncbi:hypothetical protein EV383_4661 [Pseudonocardia sediminis]|uniref:Uncharacterized protein n=1 Tax=Pseudonocardia sediminis TaxID=1397368 RepID=A0A4Q7V0V8_PSEST|nr:hypothetical protein [Pseudonocardia sediminis]RZT87735.1 hypothetical protein EV383_4661 [Pseudonocardia sediminis]
MSSTAAQENTWSPLQWVGAVVAWLWVVVPFGYGLYQLLIKIPALFG